MVQKTIVVVGAGEGLGNHIAKEFGKRDFKICLIARNAKKLNAYKQEFKKEGIETFVYEADCERPHTLKTAFEKILESCGSIEVLIYNAATMESGIATSLDNDNFLRHYQVDVASALFCTKFVVEN